MPLLVLDKALTKLSYNVISIHWVEDLKVKLSNKLVYLSIISACHFDLLLVDFCIDY